MSKFAAVSAHTRTLRFAFFKPALFSSVGFRHVILSSQGRWFESDKSKESGLSSKRLKYISYEDSIEGKRVLVLGQIPEWPNGANCKSAGLRLQWTDPSFTQPVSCIIAQQ